MKAKPQLTIHIPENQKVFFASDFHLGAPDYAGSRQREQVIVQWLEEIKLQSAALFLLGDLFDFWFEYKYAVPKGHIRFLGKLAEIRDAGIPLHIFTGNHDMWMFDYFEQELDATIHRQPISLQLNDKLLHVGHGDGLGPADYTFKVLKKVFNSGLSQRAFAAIHPRWGIGLANRWSASSRKKNLKKDESFKDKEQEWIYHYCRDMEKQLHHDYYIFGHRHLPLELPLENSVYFNTGEWVSARTYGVFNGHDFVLKKFES
jgi:UDP-2,3-diacylglucosamine hydrolase